MSCDVDIEKRLADFTLNVRFSIDRPHEILALLGPSGCGKSMTLKCIAGVERPDRGRIALDGHVLFDSSLGIDLPPQQRRVGYLFQSYALFPHMSVWQNVMAGAVGATRTEREYRARAQLSAMRLEGLEHRMPAELSGGQQQRCAMARILANEPDLILLDEPFSALDGYLRWQLELELSDVLHDFPGGAVYVSHNRDEVYRLCDSVCVLSGGRSEPKRGVREMFAAPTSLAAALISGCKNVSHAEVRGACLVRCSDWGVSLRTSSACSQDVSYVGIRAHYFTAYRVSEQDVPAENVIACIVDRVIESTFSVIVMVKTPGGAAIRYECGKDRWKSLASPQRLLLYVAPENVMPLVDGVGGTALTAGEEDHRA